MKLKNSALNDEEWEYFSKHSMDSLLYWVNSTSQILGINNTLTLLTDVTMTCYVEMIPSDQVDRAEKIIKKQVKEVFELIRAKNEKSTQVSDKESDKESMN